MKYKELTFANVLSNVLFFHENKLSRMGKFIQPKRAFWKLSNFLTFCVTFDDLLFIDISPFAVASEGKVIEN